MCIENFSLYYLVFLRSAASSVCAVLVYLEILNISAFIFVIILKYIVGRRVK